MKSKVFKDALCCNWLLVTSGSQFSEAVFRLITSDNFKLMILDTIEGRFTKVMLVPFSGALYEKEIKPL